MTRRYGGAVPCAILAGCLALAPTAARAQGRSAAADYSPRALADRAQIEDLLTRYYYNLGHGGADSFGAYYTDDAELVLGGNSYRGKDGVANAYKVAGQNSPARKAFSFNVLLSNPLVTVHGDTATAQLVFTEIVIDAQGVPPRLIEQGREYDELVRAGGQWRFRRRQILPGAQVPAGWPG